MTSPLPDAGTDPGEQAITLCRAEGGGWWLLMPDSGDLIEIVKPESDGGFRIADMVASGYLAGRFPGWLVENWTPTAVGYVANLAPAAAAQAYLTGAGG